MKREYLIEKDDPEGAGDLLAENWRPVAVSMVGKNFLTTGPVTYAHAERVIQRERADASEAKHPKFRASVQIELRAESEGDIDDLIHATWEAGDPEDATDAVVWVTDVEPVADDATVSEAKT